MVYFPIDLDQETAMHITVHSALGRRVRSTTFTVRGVAGRVLAIWDGRDQDGALVPGGIYFVRIRAEAGWEATRKVMLVR